MPSSLQHELYKKGPFDSPEQEAYLSLVRTQSIFVTCFERLFKKHGLSQATYNALRVLRGSGTSGRMCHEIGQHLVAQVPDVTRLVDRLEEAGYVKRQRSSQDRRVITVTITKPGLDLLSRLDPLVALEHTKQLGHMNKADLDQLNQLLAKARLPHVKPENQAEKRSQ